MNRLTRCDEEGVPKIVQSVFWSAALGARYFDDTYIFNISRPSGMQRTLYQDPEVAEVIAEEEWIKRHASTHKQEIIQARK